MTLTMDIVYRLQFLIYIVSKTRRMIERSIFYGMELNSRFLSVKFTAWQKISRWPLSKIIVLIKARTSEEQQPNRRNSHDQDVAVNVLSSTVGGDCCKPPIRSGKAPPCFTSSTEFSGAMLSVCGQILRPVFVIPSYSDFQILVKPHRILAVCVCGK